VVLHDHERLYGSQLQKELPHGSLQCPRCGGATLKPEAFTHNMGGRFGFTPIIMPDYRFDYETAKQYKCDTCKKRVYSNEQGIVAQVRARALPLLPRPARLSRGSARCCSWRSTRRTTRTSCPRPRCSRALGARAWAGVPRSSSLAP